MDNPDFCETHHVAMIREQVHIGDGKTTWSKPFCPACREIASRHETDEVDSDPLAADKQLYDLPADRG
jgi:hypothetical protein